MIRIFLHHPAPSVDFPSNRRHRVGPTDTPSLSPLLRIEDYPAEEFQSKGRFKLLLMVN